VVSVRLVADIGAYQSAMMRAAATTSTLGDNAMASSKKAQSGFDLAGKGALLLGGAAVAGFGMAISKAADFDRSMSGVQAATRASASELDDLREAAMKAGADTAFSAGEAADAITEMAKAGVSTADILDGGLNGALALAAAGELEVADAAEIAASAMTQFGLSGEDIPHIADLLAAGAGKAQGSVQDMGQALNQAGLIANAAGLSIEETTGGLAAFASAGLIGSDAGTSFKTMLQALQAPSGKSAELMAQLGIDMYDANGEMLGLSEMAGVLQSSLGHLTEEQRNAALAQIFGSDAVRAANVLYREGSAGITEWTAKVNDTGYAAEEAAIKQDNLRGDLEKLGGAWDTLLIQLGSGAQGPLREVVQAFTGILDIASGVLDFWSDLPGPVQIAIGALGGIALLKGPVGDALDTIRLRAMYAADAITAPGGLKAAGSSLLGVFGGPWGLAITGAVTGLTLLTTWLGKSDDAAAESAAKQGELAAALERTQGVIDKTVRTAAAEDLVSSGLNDWADELGISVTTMTDALLGVPGAVDQVNDAWKSAISGEYVEIIDANGQVTGSYTEQGDAMLAARDKFAALAGLLPENVQRQQEVAEAAAVTGEAMAVATVQTEEAIKAHEDWLKALQGIAEGFVEPLDAYKGLLDSKMAKERESAEATAASTEDASDSWEDYATDVTVSLNELAVELENQLRAHDEWSRNIGIITQRGGSDVGRILAEMGEEGVQIAAAMANGTDAEFNRMADLLRETTRRAGTGAAAEFDYYMKMMELVGSSGGRATVQSMAAALGLGVEEVRRIANAYGVSLAEGINPILGAVGARQIAVGRALSGPGTYGDNRPGYAEGGYTGPGGKYQPAGIVHAGEYVLTQEQVNKLGVDAIEAFANGARPGLPGYATGGFVTSADVPWPYSTGRAGYPVSYAANRTMQKGYDGVTRLLDYLNAVKAANEAKAAAAAAASAGGPAGAGAVGGGWQAIFNHVKAAIPQARVNSAYRPGDPGYHGRGKAVDIGFGTGPGGAGSAGLASINRYLHDTIGGNLAELIYDGIGDDRPDLKNGRPLNYGASTQAAHRNHVHAAVYDQGGMLRPGFTLAYNGTGRNETIRTARQEDALSGPLPVLLQLDRKAVTDRDCCTDR
jgi:TP901 family phage tail tape measure protein